MDFRSLCRQDAEIAAFCCHGCVAGLPGTTVYQPRHQRGSSIPEARKQVVGQCGRQKSLTSSLGRSGFKAFLLNALDHNLVTLWPPVCPSSSAPARSRWTMGLNGLSCSSKTYIHACIQLEGLTCSFSFGFVIVLKLGILFFGRTRGTHVFIQLEGRTCNSFWIYDGFKLGISSFYRTTK